METAATLTPFGLFLQAGMVAKIVMLLLLGASIWCWVLIIEGAWSIARLKRAVRAARLGEQHEPTALLFPIVDAGRRAESLAIPGKVWAKRESRVADAMSRAAQSLLAGIEGGLPNLAVISSVAPFIGLFGTVWGIMVSFSAIADAKDTKFSPSSLQASPKPLQRRPSDSPPRSRRRSATTASERRWHAPDRICST